MVSLCLSFWFCCYTLPCPVHSMVEWQVNHDQQQHAVVAGTRHQYTFWSMVSTFILYAKTFQRISGSPKCFKFNSIFSLSEYQLDPRNNLQDIYARRCQSRAKKIIRDPVILTISSPPFVWEMFAVPESLNWAGELDWGKVSTLTQSICVLKKNQKKTSWHFLYVAKYFYTL